MDGGRSDPAGWHWLWTVYIAGMCGAAVAAIYLLEDRLPTRSSLGGVLAIAVMVAWLTVAGRAVPRMGPLSARSIAYNVVAVALWAVAVWLAPGAVVAIPALYPIVFSTLPMSAAMVAAVLVTLLPLAIDIANSGVHSSHFPVAVSAVLIGLVAGPIVGFVITSAVKQRIVMADLIEALEASRAETSRLSREAGVTAERERLALEIHDTLAQGFTSIVTLAQAMQANLTGDSSDRDAAIHHLALIEATARENLAETRTMVTRLTPTALDGATLPAAIRRQCAGFTAETGIDTDVRVADDTPSAGMAGDVVLLRVAQEALANVRRHAKASHVRVELGAAGDGVRLSLADNGIGLSQEHVDGFGLRGIRTRVAQAGGAVSVTSESGAGTTVMVEVPA